MASTDADPNASQADSSEVYQLLDAFEDVLVQMHKFPGPAWDVIADIGKSAISSRAR